MLNTIRLSVKILALGYSNFTSFGLFHSALLASWNHDFNCCSQSAWASQKSRNIFFAITLKD